MKFSFVWGTTGDGQQWGQWGSAKSQALSTKSRKHRLVVVGTAVEAFRNSMAGSVSVMRARFIRFVFIRTAFKLIPSGLLSFEYDFCRRLSPWIIESLLLCIEEIPTDLNSETIDFEIDFFGVCFREELDVISQVRRGTILNGINIFIKDRGVPSVWYVISLRVWVFETLNELSGDAVGNYPSNLFPC